MWGEQAFRLNGAGKISSLSPLRGATILTEGAYFSLGFKVEVFFISA